MLRSTRVGTSLALVTLLGLSSCATTTRLETTWRLPTYSGKPLKKLAVLAVMKNANDSRSFEIAAVQRLKRAGIQAIPGFRFAGDLKKLTKAELEKRVKATGADGVLVFKLIAVDKSRTYVPPSAYVIDDGTYNDWWGDAYWGYYTPFPYDYWGYYWPAYQVVNQPGYWVTDSNFQVETALYRVSTNKLVFTAMSGTYDPRGEYDLGRSVTAAVVKKLEQDRLVRPST